MLGARSAGAKLSHHRCRRAGGTRSGDFGGMSTTGGAGGQPEVSNSFVRERVFSELIATSWRDGGVMDSLGRLRNLCSFSWVKLSAQFSPCQPTGSAPCQGRHASS